MTCHYGTVVSRLSEALGAVCFHALGSLEDDKTSLENSD